MAELTVEEFLLERIAERERDARVCSTVYPGPWDLYDRGYTAKVSANEPNFLTIVTLDQEEQPVAEDVGDALLHIARHDPIQVLAECAAMRQIVEQPESDDPSGWTDGWREENRRVVRVLAAAHAHHPDYREDWRPEETPG